MKSEQSMMKKVATPRKPKPKVVSLVLPLALLLANFYYYSPAFADPSPTAQQHFAVTVFDVAGNASATQHFTVNVTSPDSLTLSIEGAPVNLSGAPGALQADYLTVNVKTTNAAGYRLDIEAAEPRLKCASSDDYFNPLAGSGSMTDDRWGYAVDNGTVPSEPALWTGMTNSATTIKTFGMATDPADGDDTTLWFGAQASLTLPACVYSGEITITAVAE
jgi:hypothetical protein